MQDGNSSLHRVAVWGDGTAVRPYYLPEKSMYPKWEVMVVSHRSNRTHRPDRLVEFRMKEKLLFRKCDMSSALISNGASVHEANNVRSVVAKTELSHCDLY